MSKRSHPSCRASLGFQVHIPYMRKARLFEQWLIIVLGASRTYDVGRYLDNLLLLLIDIGCMNHLNNFQTSFEILEENRRAGRKRNKNGVESKSSNHVKC